MTIWFCTACGYPSGSTGDTCRHFGTLRTGGAPAGSALAGIPPLPPPGPLPPPPGFPPEPVTAPPGTTGPTPVAQYEVMAPGQPLEGQPFEGQPFEGPPVYV